ncbi:MAG: CapA family protein [Fibrobacterota bacterium]
MWPYILGALGAFFGFYVFSDRRRPWKTESDLSNRLFFYFKFYYSTKYLSSVKRAADNGLEAYFKNNTAPVYAAEDTSSSCTISAAGDLMMRRDLAFPASRNVWAEIEDTLFDADFTTGNLEFAVNPSRQYYQIIRYSVEEKYAEPFLDLPQKGSFDYVSIANNHINDSYTEGICHTIDFLNRKGVYHSGCAKSADDRDDFPVVDIGGIKTAFLAYSFSTNGIPLDRGFEHGVNLIRFNALKDEDYDPSLIFRHIQLAKERGAELIVANNHWGIEFEYYPSPRLVRRAHELMDAGVDIIIGHHPHMVNPSEWYRTKDGRNALCFYSLGNLTSFALKRPTMKMSQIVRIRVEKESGGDRNSAVRISQAEIIPTFFCKKGRGTHADHRILPLFETAQKIREGRCDTTLSRLRRFQILHACREYERYFLQKHAFSYR